MRRIGLGLLLLSLPWAGQAAPAAPPAPASAPASAARPDPRVQFHDEALKRLEKSVQQQEYWRPRDKTPLRWEQPIVPPDPGKLLWSARQVKSISGMLSWRAAVDMRTRWYYVSQIGGDMPARFYGPLHEVSEGAFADLGSSEVPRPPPKPKTTPR